MRVLDLFAGIGGFSLGLERAGFETVAFCEIEPYAQKVLAKHWPGVPIYDDVRELTAERLAGDGVFPNAICGGYPCQPFSCAGGRAGEADNRHLWPEFARLISEIRPRWVIGENVVGHISMGLDQVLSDLEALGYTARTFVIPACAINAPHIRNRVWILADSKCERQQGQGRHIKPVNTAPDRNWEASGFVDAFQRGTLPYVCREHDGISSGVDRLRCLGNAVVPQIPEIIGRAIMEAECGY
jgi:DNA (cytosine-5)-methyltransferase 1